jgi:hypothetical protein
MPLQTLEDRVGLLPGVVKERELTTARKVVHQVLTMFDSHYKGLDCKALSSGWAPGYPDDEYDKLKEDCAIFAHAMVDVAMKDLYLIPKDIPEVKVNSINNG